MIPTPPAWNKGFICQCKCSFIVCLFVFEDHHIFAFITRQKEADASFRDIKINDPAAETLRRERNCDLSSKDRAQRDTRVEQEPETAPCDRFRSNFLYNCPRPLSLRDINCLNVFLCRLISTIKILNTKARLHFTFYEFRKLGNAILFQLMQHCCLEVNWIQKNH